MSENGEAYDATQSRRASTRLGKIALMMDKRDETSRNSRRQRHRKWAAWKGDRHDDGNEREFQYEMGRGEEKEKAAMVVER
jgi:hypothetical protein